MYVNVYTTCGHVMYRAYAANEPLPHAKRVASRSHEWSSQRFLCDGQGDLHEDGRADGEGREGEELGYGGGGHLQTTTEGIAGSKKSTGELRPGQHVLSSFTNVFSRWASLSEQRDN